MESLTHDFAKGAVNFYEKISQWFSERISQAYSAIAFQEDYSRLCILLGSPDQAAPEELKSCLVPGEKNYAKLLDDSVLNSMRSNTTNTMTNLGDLYTATIQEFNCWMTDPTKQKWIRDLSKVRLSDDHCAAFERLLKVLNMKPPHERKRIRSNEHPLVFDKVCRY